MGGGPEALTHFWHSFNNFLVRRLYTAIRRILGGVGVGWGGVNVQLLTAVLE